MKIEECGCYDGPWSPDDPTVVTVRCAEHALDPGYRDGAHRMTAQEAKIAAAVAIKRNLKKGLLRPPVKQERRQRA